MDAVRDTRKDDVNQTSEIDKPFYLRRTLSFKETQGLKEEGLSG